MVRFVWVKKGSRKYVRLGFFFSWSLNKGLKTDEE